MAELYLHGRELKSIFELLGEDEDDITYSIGWALANCPSFLRDFIAHVLRKPSFKLPGDARVYLQESKKTWGRTDIEIRCGELHIIIEAKRGWVLPSPRQLQQYVPRFLERNIKHTAIVAMAECSHEYAKLHLPSALDSRPLHFVNWKDIVRLSKKAKMSSHSEKRLLEQLRAYIGGLVNMQNQQSNMVYVVALSKDIPWYSKISYIDVVTKRRRYYHPATTSWPSDPPNYIGFRYDGRLQRIHHVESWEIVDDLSKKMKDIKRHPGDFKMFLYKLGAPIIPNKIVKTGNIPWAGRVKAMLDLLLTCDSIYEASEQTKKRLSEQD